MRDSPAVNRWIRNVLSGSGLPMDRRTEIADEWHDHLHECIASKSATGSTLEDAIRAALAEFGDPAQLRRRLRREQRASDFRDALVKTRPIAIWMVGGALCASVGAAVFLPGPTPTAYRLAVGCGLFVAITLLAIVPAFVASLLEQRVTRTLPIEEFHLVRSLVRWTVVVAVFFVGIMSFGPAACSLIGYFAQDIAFVSIQPRIPEIIHGAPWLIWRNLAVAMCELPLSSFVIPSITTLCVAMAITLYERSRCVRSTAEAVTS